jgi:hypothetical protein
MPLKVGFGAVDQAIALDGSEDRWKVLHDLRVAIHRGEGFAVGELPAAQQQAVRLESGY